MKMKRALAAIPLLAAGLSSAGASSAGGAATPSPIVSRERDRSEVAVTIHNDNLGLVRETRTLPLAGGRNEVRFMDVAAQIDPRTVHIASLTSPRGLTVLEQSYEYDLISPDKLMEK